MIVTLPWPDKLLSPNARQHWAALSAAKKKARRDAHYATLEALGGRACEVRALVDGETPLPVTVRFFPPDRRHRDADNMVASMKAAIDGFADALGVNDRRFRPTFVFADPAKPGRVEVEIACG